MLSKIRTPIHRWLAVLPAPRGDMCSIGRTSCLSTSEHSLRRTARALSVSRGQHFGRHICSDSTCCAICKRSSKGGNSIGQELGPEEIRIAFSDAASTEYADKATLNKYAEILLPSVPTLTPRMCVEVLHSLAKAKFKKYGLTNKLSAIVLQGQADLCLSNLCQYLHDLKKLDMLEATYLLGFIDNLRTNFALLTVFDFFLILQCLSHVGLREEDFIFKICDHFLKHPSSMADLTARRFQKSVIGNSSLQDECAGVRPDTENQRLNPNVTVHKNAPKIIRQRRIVITDFLPSYCLAPTFIFCLCKLNINHPFINNCFETAIAFHMNQFTHTELVLLCYCIIALNQTEQRNLLYEALQRLAKENATLVYQEINMMLIVSAYLKYGAGPVSIDVTEETSAFLGRLRPVNERAPSSSSMQRRVEQLFTKLKISAKSEFQIGPYIADFAVTSRKIVVEMDGFTHFYAFSRDPNRKTLLKRQILNAMGWKVVSLPFYEWTRKVKEEKFTQLLQALR